MRRIIGGVVLAFVQLALTAVFAALALLMLAPDLLPAAVAGGMGERLVALLTRPLPFGRSELGVVSALVSLAFALSIWPRPSADRRRSRPPAQALGVTDLDPNPAPKATPEPTLVAEPVAEHAPLASAPLSQAAPAEIEVVEVRDIAPPAAEANLPDPALLEPTAAFEAVMSPPEADAPAEPGPNVDPAPLVDPAPDPTDHDAAVAEARAAWLAEPSQTHRIRLADLLKKSGDIADSLRRVEDATAAYQESLALRRTVVTAAPKDADQQRWLWITLEALADCYEARGLRARAAALCDDALHAAEQAVALTPGHSSWTTDLTDTRMRALRLKAEFAE